MAVFQTSGNAYDLTSDIAVVIPSTVYNNVTGQQGVKFLRLLNTTADPAAEIATVTWTLESTAYTYNNMPVDEQSIDQLGTGALFNVSVTYDAETGLGVYNVTIANAGTGYNLLSPTLVIYKENLGGNFQVWSTNLSFNITGVDGDGAITEISSVAGNGAWPQVPTGSTKVLPMSEAVVQVLPSSDIADGLVLVSPITGTVVAEVVNVISG